MLSLSRESGITGTRIWVDRSSLYQKKRLLSGEGEPIRLLNMGDVVEIHADIVHWHGATPDSEFEHIAISSQSHKVAIVWLEPITDKEYNTLWKIKIQCPIYSYYKLKFKNCFCTLFVP